MTDEISKKLDPETEALLQILALGNKQIEEGQYSSREEVREYFRDLAEKRGA